MFEEELFNNFVREMNQAVIERKNIYGDSWKNSKPEFLEQRLMAKMTEFKLTKNPKKLISLANLAMMLYTRLDNND